MKWIVLASLIAAWTWLFYYAKNMHNANDDLHFEARTCCLSIRIRKRHSCPLLEKELQRNKIVAGVCGGCQLSHRQRQSQSSAWNQWQSCHGRNHFHCISVLFLDLTDDVESSVMNSVKKE